MIFLVIESKYINKISSCSNTCYATQASARPPTFAIFGNQLSKMPESYTRYLMNGLRKDFELWGVPIRFSLRGGKNPFDKDK